MTVPFSLMKRMWQIQRRLLRWLRRQALTLKQSLEAWDAVRQVQVREQVWIAQTGVEALACSFGTTHGIYLTEPRLDFSVVENVRKECDGLPVVMHGGSGVSVEDFHKAIKAGVRKINYYTYADKAALERAKRILDGEPSTYVFADLTVAARQGAEENLRTVADIIYNA